MVIVLIAARYQKILGWMEKACGTEIQSMDIIKQDGAKIYLYIETTLDTAQVIKRFHHVIYKECQDVYIYQIYGIYHGKIDFHDYMTPEGKDKLSYYQTKNKDITDQEIELYLDKEDKE